MEFCHTDNHCIKISNIENGETLCYSLPLIKGEIFTKNGNKCFNCSTGKIMLHHYNDNGSLMTATEWHVANSEFKCLVSLLLGRNILVFEYCDTQLKMSLEYHPRRTVLRVTPVYIICQGHDGLFQAPTNVDNTVPSACERIALGARLIQSLTAEKLYESKVGRKTFQLECDLNQSGPECIVFHSHLPVEKARKMDPTELWKHFGSELMISPLGNKDRKFLALLSCTLYNLPKNKELPKTHEDTLSAVEAHVALGGGGLALFGSACLYTWPRHMGEIIPRFLDISRVDTRYFMDDSGYRGTYGGCFATTLGAVCHELGHTFDLGHTPDGIMGRGFDNVNLVFTVQSCEDNESYSYNRNRYVSSPVCKELAQHSTLSFTKVLNVSYTMSPRIKRPQNKAQGNITVLPNISERSTSDIDDLCESNQNRGQINNGNNVKHPKRLNNPQIPTVFQMERDCTHWSKNCGAFLSFHRWFNDENVAQGASAAISYDENQNVVSSSVGIRVVEVRDESELVLSSWQFLESDGVEEFALPPDVLLERSFILIAEDSAGNILRYSL